MALLPFDLFARISSRLGSMLRARLSPALFTALAIDDASRWGLASRIHVFATLHVERVMNAIQRAVPVPKVE